MATALVSQENVVASLVSRTGRHLQRYDKGRRQVVGWVGFPLSFSLLIFFSLVN
jgi:diphosphoinositol-polyphosphate diphosphatase